MKSCSHDTCPEVNCHFNRDTFEKYGRERQLWAIEKSGVRIGQRYKSWQHGDTCRIVAIGRSTDCSDEAMVAFEVEDQCVTYFIRLKDFTESIAGHRKWELLS